MRNVVLCLAMLGVDCSAVEKPSVYMQNKLALQRAVKIYLAFEARHDVVAGVDADLKLPEKARFRSSLKEGYSEWIYPIALGLEILVDEPQRRVVVMAPRSCFGWYLLGTDDLTVKAYRYAKIEPIFKALAKRRQILAKSPLD